MSMDPIALGIPKAAALVDVSENTFRREVLPFVRVVMVGSRPKVLVAEVIAWAEQHAVGKFGGKDRSGDTPSASGSVADAENSRRGSSSKERETELKRRRAKSTRGKSAASRNVAQLKSHLRKAQSRRPTNG